MTDEVVQVAPDGVGLNATLVVDGNGNTVARLNVGIGGGTAGSPSGGVQSVQGVVGGVAIPISGSFSATLSGFAPGGAYAQLSVSGTSGNVALPAGLVVVVYNTGANSAFVKLGTSNAVVATVADDVVAAGGWSAFTVGANTYLAAITSSSTTALNLSGGSGLMTGAAGGSGGGGGGSVPTGSAGSPNAAVVTVQGISGATALNVAAASLPLPTNAAAETGGNLAAVAAAAGTTADSAYAGTGTATMVASLKGVYAAIKGSLTATISGTVAVTGTFWQTTQPVSAASLPLPAGAATSANQSAVFGSAAGGTAAASSELAGGVYNATLPTLTNSQQAALQFDSSGRVLVNGSTGASFAVTGTFWQTTQPVSGTFWQTTQPVSAASLPLPTGAATSANQPTNAGIASTTSGQTGELNMGAVTTAAPTYTTGQTNPISLTTSGSLRADLSSLAGSALGVPSNYGTSPGGVMVQGVNAFVTNTPAVSQSGTWNVTNVSGVVSLPTGAATAANQTSVIGTAAAGAAATNSELIGGIFNTSLPSLTNGQQAAAQLDSSGRLFVNGSGVTQPVNGTVTAAQATAANLNATIVGTGTLAVQLTGATNNVNNISGAISLPTGAATSANQPTNAAQGSTTSGQTGTLTLGAVSTSAPSYTNAQSSPHSLTLAGALRVDASATTQPVSGTLTQGNTPVGPAAIAVGQSAMTATAALIVAARTGAPGTGRVSCLLYNQGSNTVAVGGSGVAYATGLLILPGGAATIDTTAALYGICNTGLTSTVGFLETF